MNSWCYLTRSGRATAARRGGAAYFGRKMDLCHNGLRRIGGGRAVLAHHPLQRAGFDAGSQSPHELQVVMQVVDGVEPRAEDFVASVEVPQVRARVVAARVTGAFRIEWTGVRLV